MTYLLCDLSEFQRSVDFAQLHRDGVAGVMIRASYGRSSTDPTCLAKVKAAHRAGLRVGLYHYAYPQDNSAKDEADNLARMIANVGGILGADLRPMLDLEEDQLNAGRFGPWARAFCQRVKLRTGTLPLFYSYGPYIEAMRLSKPIGAGLVLAAYGRNDGKDYPVVPPAPWKHYAAHQFTSSGRLQGVAGRVDLWHAVSLKPLLAHPLIGRLL